jgi:hypothetical protein
MTEHRSTSDRRRPGTEQITVRIHKSSLRKLDRWIDDQRVVGARFTRSTVLRDLLLEHLKNSQEPDATAITL